MLTLARVLQPALMCGFQELTADLQDLLTQTLEHIKDQEAHILSLKLTGLTLEGHSQVGAVQAFP